MAETNIQDLPGVGAATAEKLVEAGYDNLMSIAVASPGQITEASGVGEAVARKIIRAARDRLDMGFESGADLLKKRAEIIKIRTGHAGFDTLLGGGFETGSISECFGEFGCVSHDTMLTLADGSMKTFLEIADGRPAGEYAVEIPITTWFNNSLSKTMTKTLFIYDCPKLVNITLEDGRALKVTPNHPLMTQDGWKNASKLTNGENLVVSWHQEFPKDLVRLSTKINLHKKAPISKVKKVNLPPHLTESLARIIGYQLGEGWKEKMSKTGGITRVSFGSSTQELLDSWSDAVQEVFGISPSFRKKENNTTTLAIDSVMVGEFLKQFDGLYRLAKNKEVPGQIMKSPKGVITSFLATLYDSEGYSKLEHGKGKKTAKWLLKDGTEKKREYLLDKKGKSVELRSSSLALIQQVQLLLSKFRIKTSITKDYTNGFVCYKLHIYRQLYIQRFYDNIGIKTIRLRGKISDILSQYKNEIKTLDLNVLKIRSIEEVNNEHGKVYDIEVPQTHSFLANNVVSHNSSKSQIAHVLAVQVQIPKDKGGPEGKCIFIDGENTFRPERIIQLAEGVGMNPNEALDGIHVAKAFNSDHQMLLAEKAEELLKKDPTIRLIVVDSLTSHFRADFIGRGQLADRQQRLNKHMHVLMRMANQYNVCVYVTNQVMAKPDMFFGDPTAAIGGNIVAHNSQVRIYLRKGKKGSRVAKLIDSPYLPDGETAFMVTDGGLKEI
ncbi:MAG: DNA repair and recombination protein RadA [Nanoarchaeota archaeon]